MDDLQSSLQRSQEEATQALFIKVSLFPDSFFLLCVLNLSIDVLNKHAAAYHLGNKSGERSKHPHEPSSPASVQLGNYKGAQRGGNVYDDSGTNSFLSP